MKEKKELEDKEKEKYKAENNKLITFLNEKIKKNKEELEGETNILKKRKHLIKIYHL